MAHRDQDVEVHHEGDYHEIRVSIEDTDEDPVDLTDASAEWLLLEDELDPDEDAVLTKTGEQNVDESEISFPEPIQGDLIVHIATGDTDGLVDWTATEQPVSYHHRLRMTTADGERATVLHGDFNLYR